MTTFLVLFHLRFLETVCTGMECINKYLCFLSQEATVLLKCVIVFTRTSDEVITILFSRVRYISYLLWVVCTLCELFHISTVNGVVVVCKKSTMSGF